MKKNISNSLLIIAIAISLFSCKSKKSILKPVSAAPVEAISSKPVILKNILSGQTNFNTLSMKAKADLALDKNSFNATFNIRMQKDKVIWISATAIAGIEVARLLITPDSIRIINRLEKTYVKKPLNYIYQFTSKQVNFITLQSILIGDCVPELVNNDSELSIDSGEYMLSGLINELAYRTVLNQDFDVLQNDLKDEKAKQELAVKYNDYIQAETNHLPRAVNIQSKINNKSISINLEYNQFDLNKPVDFPFSIPERFSERN